jgi:hypothetical protein
MTETKSDRRPRRDADGRLASVGDLLGVAFAGLVSGIVLLLAFEGLMSLVGLSKFGDSSGWLALILPVWLFVEEFRSARYGAYRVVVAVLGAGLGVAVGMTLAGFASATFPALVSGAVGAAGFTIVYSLIWFSGLRWLSRRAD